ncbi:MAG TPA: glycosyltransferase family 2 protein [Thermoleophilaceae bacterium]|jgi:hypothetical protein
MALPDLSVVVVTHDGRELALSTLRSAMAAANGASCEWIVVDSGSRDGTPELIEREFGDVRVIRCENVGFAAANNVALRVTRGHYVLLLNPDVEVHSGGFAELVAAMDQRPSVGVASVIQLASDGSLQPSIRRYPSPLRQLGEALGLRRLGEEETRPARYESERSADWLVGAFLLARREALRQVGGLDERFFLYAEEADWCYRFRRSGWDVRHLPLMRVTHHAGECRRPDLFAQNSHSKLLFAEKHFSRPRRIAFRAALVVRHGIRVAALAPPALVWRRIRGRMAREWAALRLVLGLSPPPFQGAAISGARSGYLVTSPAYGWSSRQPNQSPE